jgi:Na+/phosphate symporter
MGKMLIDQYSLLHFATGVIAYFFGISSSYWLILNILFEFIENSAIGVKIIDQYIKVWPGGKKSSDYILNSTSDIIFCMLGWYIAFILDKKLKIKMFAR